MLKIALCDDEPYMLDELTGNMNRYFSERNILVSIVQFQSGKSLLSSNNTFDAVFLDIQMNGMDGMETAKLLRKNGFRGYLIFITVLQEKVFDSFDVQAYDYIIKPLAIGKLTRTIDRMLTDLQEKEEKKLLIQRGNAFQSVSLADIAYCEVMNRKIYIHTFERGVIDFYDQIDNLERKVSEHFFRCHRSYLVNMEYVVGFENCQARLKNGDTIPVSRLRSREFLDRVLQYMKGWS